MQQHHSAAAGRGRLCSPADAEQTSRPACNISDAPQGWTTLQQLAEQDHHQLLCGNPAAAAASNSATVAAAHAGNGTHTTVAADAEAARAAAGQFHPGDSTIQHLQPPNTADAAAGAAAAATGAAAGAGLTARATASPALRAEASSSSRGSRGHLRSATLADSSDLDDSTSSDISSSCSAHAADKDNNINSSSNSSILHRRGSRPGFSSFGEGEQLQPQPHATLTIGDAIGSNVQQQQQQRLDKAQQQDGALQQQQQQQQQQDPQQQQDAQQQQQKQQQQQQQQQQPQSVCRISSSSAAASNSTPKGRPNRLSADPDYELPQGKLTETQVLMSHGDKLHLDRYGFIVSEAEASARAEARSRRPPAQVKRDQRQLQKWRRMLGSGRDDWEAYQAAQPRKVKRRVRKGIPDEFRGLVWQYLSGGRVLMARQPGHYAQLLTSANEAVDMEIMRDLNRTFPNHVFFHQRQGPGQQSLFHVLRAYSAYDSVVGYVQGMGFVCAILLMYMSEEEAFWTLVALLKGTALSPPLEGLYQAGMPLLQQCLFQFQELLKQEHPRLGGHMEQEGVVPSMYCTHWFNTIFAYSLPFEQLLRVWDVFLLEGMKVVFRVGLALLSSAQEQLVAMPFEKLVAALNGRKFPVLERHPNALLRAALRIPVSRRLELLRERYQQLQAEAEAAAASGSGSGGAAVAAAHP